MKNIHILPTDKPSRLIIQNGNKLILGVLDYSIIENRQHIYITNDDEIKEGDWFIDITLTNNGLIYKSAGFSNSLGYEGWVKTTTNIIKEPKTQCTKIILTTDQDLIAEGIQPIDDTFLEWFVENPSCESVEISYGVLKPFQSTDKGYMIHLPDNEVLGEPKQETLEEARKVERSDLYNKIYSIVKQIPREDVETDAMDASSCAYDIEQLFYKWQQERMYSEEEVDKLLDTLLHNNMCSVAGDELIKQFKKK
jgi:hypothetical protein